MLDRVEGGFPDQGTIGKQPEWAGFALLQEGSGEMLVIGVTDLGQVGWEASIRLVAVTKRDQFGGQRHFGLRF